MAKKKWTAAERAAFAARMAKYRKKGLAKKRAKKGTKRRATNPVRGMFQIAAIMANKKTVVYFTGRNAMNTDRREAANYTEQKAAQKVALNLNWKGPLVVVNSTVTPQKIRGYLTGK